jgi:hypothetical protein
MKSTATKVKSLDKSIFFIDLLQVITKKNYID